MARLNSLKLTSTTNPKTIKAIGKPSSLTHLKNVLKLYGGITEAYSEPYQTKWSFLRK